MSYIHNRNETLKALKLAEELKSYYSFGTILKFKEWTFRVKAGRSVRGFREFRFKPSQLKLLKHILSHPRV